MIRGSLRQGECDGSSHGAEGGPSLLFKFQAMGFRGGDGKEWGEKSESAQVKRVALQK